MLAQKQRVEDIEREEKQYAQDYNLRQKTMALQNRQAKMGMGIEAAKLGLNVAGTFKNKTLGGEGGILSGLGSKFASGTFLGDLKPAGLIGGGLAGFGASKLVKGKSKTKKAGVGALAGAGIGALTGGGISGMISGALSGGLGGLFG
jgi:hypothetical protein